MNSRILLIECVDQKGLIHEVTGVLLRSGQNIISNSEFVDQETNTFFMRTEFEGEDKTDAIRAELQSILPKEAILRFPNREKRRIVILATKEHHCLGDLLLRHAYHEINGSLLAVISNHPGLEPLVKRFDIPFQLISHEGKTREEHESELLSALKAYDPEYIVLAKYMRILSPEFIAQFPRRIINIHHSFLPAFVGASPYRQAFQRGVKIIGATAHFVTEQLDEGPIISQNVIPVDHTYTVEGMVQAGRDVEKRVLANALKLVFEERVFLCGKRTVIFS
ncbi:MAG: formyltetrahydrofolate deformylase [Candidatus Riflebacteria bacterium]|nr:formyltetrahydrofolate deformylase [Candidatus Riflebacteria bacterium]